MPVVFSFLVKRDGTILKASGATVAGLGRESAALPGTSLFLLVPSRLHGILRTVLRRMTYDQAFTPLDIPVIHNKVGCMDMVLRAIPSDRATMWMDFSSDGTGLPLLRPGLISGEIAARLTEKDEFLESVEKHVSDASAPEHDLTMFDFSSQLNTIADEEEQTEAKTSIRAVLESTLSRWSVDGEIGYLKPGCYAILHSTEVGADDIVAAIPGSLQDQGIEDTVDRPFTETVHLDRSATRGENVKGLLSKVVDGFTKKAGSLFRKTKLYTTFSKVIPRLKDPVSLIRKALDEGKLEIAETSVVSMKSGESALAVARGQLQIDNDPVWIGDLVDVTSCVDLCVRHDLAVVQHVLHTLKQGRTDAPIVVEIARPSLFDRAFSRAVKSACDTVPVAQAMLGFKPVGLSFSDTRSPAFDHFCEILGYQHPIWLSNFPSTITSIDKLTKMRTEYIELPLGLLRSLSSRTNDDTMGRLVQVWRNAASHVVITGLNDAKSALLARQAGVDFGAGTIYNRH